MTSTKARLYQDVTFRATNGTKTTTRILQEVRRGPIGAHGLDSWEGIPLSIPAIPPTGLGGCRIIDVTYRLEFVVDPSGIGFDLKISMPIMIGNIPLRTFFQQILPARQNHGVPSCDQLAGKSRSRTAERCTWPESIWT